MFGRLIGKAPKTIDEFEFLYAGHGKWQVAPGCGFRPHCPGAEPKLRDPRPHLPLPRDVETLLATAGQFGIQKTDALLEVRHQINVVKTWTSRATEFMFNLNHRQIDAIAPLIDNTQFRLAVTLVGH